MVLFAACGGQKSSLPEPVKGPGAQLARSVDFALEAVNQDAPIELIDYRGKVVLVNYFATWCVPCMAEIPTFNRLVNGPNKIEGLAIIGISVDIGGAQLVEPYIEVAQIQYPVALADEASLHGRTPFGDLRAVPASFLVDPDGRHVETFLGLTPIDYLVRRTSMLLRDGGRQPQ